MHVKQKLNFITQGSIRVRYKVWDEWLVAIILYVDTIKSSRKKLKITQKEMRVRFSLTIIVENGNKNLKIIFVFLFLSNNNEIFLIFFRFSISINCIEFHGNRHKSIKVWNLMYWNEQLFTRHIDARKSYLFFHFIEYFKYLLNETH